MSTQEFNHSILGMETKLKYFAYSLTTDREEAKDLLQETYLKAITYKDLFVHQTNLKAWMYTIMKNTFINNYRKNVKMKTTVDKTANLFFINSKQKNPVAPVDSQFIHKEILETIKNLKDEYRVPFKMYTDGHKYKEIADALDLPIGTVKSRIFFARKILMENLKEYEYYQSLN